MSSAQPIRMTRRGPGLDRLLGAVAEGIDQGLVPVELFNDEEVFRAEMERIFARTWVFVAHETEIPNKGDFVLRRIGLDSVIVSRDDTGKVNVMSSHCRHRGTQVCLTDRGNATHFKCPYHGWTYKNNGEWAGAPHMREAYGERLDAKEWGLLKAPRVDSYQGFIFASLSAEGPSLKEHLGGAAWMLDTICGLHPGGMRVVGTPERSIIRADWKSGAENFSGDCYHIDTGHWSNEVTGYASGTRENNHMARRLVLDGGHGFLCHALEEMGGPFLHLWGYPPHVQAQFDLSKMDEAQVKLLNENPPTIGNIFPNLSYLRFPSTAEAGKPPAVTTTFRQWQPLEPGLMEIWNWQFTFDFMSEEDTQHAYSVGQYIFSSSGMFEQDDTVLWEGVPHAGKSVWHRKVGTMLHFRQSGIGTDAQRKPEPDWKGPGDFYGDGFGEFGQLNFYRQWLQLMRQGPEGDR
jgi:phenylpropionate dioxygenase-like ring-hydroxylating dioxygenase large terminal subunit